MHVKLVGKECNVISAYLFQVAFMESVSINLLGVYVTILQNGLDPFVISVSIEYILTIPNHLEFI